MKLVIQDDNNIDDKLFIGALTKDAKTEIKQDECFVTLDIQGTKV